MAGQVHMQRSSWRYQRGTTLWELAALEAVSGNGTLLAQPIPPPPHPTPCSDVAIETGRTSPRTRHSRQINMKTLRPTQDHMVKFTTVRSPERRRHQKHRNLDPHISKRTNMPGISCKAVLHKVVPHNYLTCFVSRLSSSHRDHHRSYFCSYVV